MSVFQPRDDNRLSKKFEGVVSDGDHSDSEEEEDITEAREEGTVESWTKADYELLVEKVRSALPKKDVKKAKSTLQNFNWEEIQVRQHSPDDVRRVALSLLAKIRSFRSLGEMLNDVPEVVTKILSADKPKAPLSAYTIFMKENIPVWRQENQELKALDMFKHASKAFHELSAKKKKKYEDAAVQSKVEYQEKLAKYYEDHPDMVPPPKSGRAPRTKEAVGKSHLKRGRNRTPFNLYYESRLEVTPAISVQQCRQEWEDLPVKSKLPFIRQSFETHEDTKLLNKKEQEMLAHFQGKPEFVGRNAFDYYRRQNRSKFDDLGGKEREQKLANDYKLLSERQLLDLKVAFLAARDEYVKQYQAYIKELPEDKQKAEIEFLQSIAGSGSNKKEKTAATKVKKPKEEDHYPGSADEDPPVAESTTIKRPPKEKKPSKKKAAPVPEQEEDEDDDDDDEEQLPSIPSPTKKSRMQPPPASPKKTVASTPKPAGEAAKKKTTKQAASSRRPESSSGEESGASASNKNGSSRKRHTTEQSPAAAAKTSEVDGKSKSKKKAKKEEEVATPPEPAMKEPERPPTVLEEYYRQRVYKGKVGKHKESLASLSAAKKREISDQMKIAQKQYIVDFERYLKSLPKDQIKDYIQKINNKRSSGGSVAAAAVAAPAVQEDAGGSTETGSSGSEEEDDE